MSTIDLHYVVSAFLDPYLSSEACLHGDVDVKEALNKVLQKKIRTLTTYVLIITYFVDFVEN
jgi:hypothetical protein